MRPIYRVLDLSHTFVSFCFRSSFRAFPRRHCAFHYLHEGLSPSPPRKSISKSLSSRPSKHLLHISFLVKPGNMKELSEVKVKPSSSIENVGQEIQGRLDVFMLQVPVDPAVFHLHHPPYKLGYRWWKERIYLLYSFVFPVPSWDTKYMCEPDRMQASTSFTEVGL